MAEEKLCPLSFNTPNQIDILNCKKDNCEWCIVCVCGFNKIDGKALNGMTTLYN